MKLIYAANARIPSDKAHPYQILQNCEAFSEAGLDVTLLYPARHNPPDLRTDDIWAYYALDHTFAAEKLFSLDLFPLSAGLPAALRRVTEPLVFWLQLLTFALSMLIRVARESDAIFYSRDPILLTLYTVLWPRRARRAFFEAHTYVASGIGCRLRRYLGSRLGGFIVLTTHLRERYAPMCPQILIAHDAIRPARFDIDGDRDHWRTQFGWPTDAYIVGYMGRFYGGLEKMDKGLDTLFRAVTAFAQSVDVPVHLALVGGPSEPVDALRAQISEQNLPSNFILYPGMVPPADVPAYLRAFDVCTIPSPWTDFYAYYTSPMKLFEYMASHRPIVASELPSTEEIIQHNVNGLLFEPANPDSLAAALRYLLDHPDRAAHLADMAYRTVMQDHTWLARAQSILSFINDTPEKIG